MLISSLSWLAPFSFFFFFNDTATTEIYTLSLHDALPISVTRGSDCASVCSLILRMDISRGRWRKRFMVLTRDRKSTRLNSSHLVISYAVFCLKKKKTALSNSVTETTPSGSGADDVWRGFW